MNNESKCRLHASETLFSFFFFVHPVISVFRECCFSIFLFFSPFFFSIGVCVEEACSHYKDKMKKGRGEKEEEREGREKKKINRELTIDTSFPLFFSPVNVRIAYIQEKKKKVDFYCYLCVQNYEMKWKEERGGGG